MCLRLRLLSALWNLRTVEPCAQKFVTVEARIFLKIMLHKSGEVHCLRAAVYAVLGSHLNFYSLYKVTERREIFAPRSKSFFPPIYACVRVSE